MALGGFASLLEEQWQTDVQLKGGDSDPSSAIPAHKLVLAARSKVFKKLLEQDEFKLFSRKKRKNECKASSTKETITISEMQHEEVKALIQFFYSSDVSISSKGFKTYARSLYIAADKYEIPDLRELCRNELMSSLSLTNALDVLELAEIPFDVFLSDAALSYIRKNISKVASSDEFKLFAVSNPELTVEIVKASLKQCLGEYSYCHSCGRW